MFSHCMWGILILSVKGKFGQGGIKSVEDDSSLLLGILMCHMTKITDVINISFLLFDPF